MKILRNLNKSRLIPILDRFEWIQTNLNLLKGLYYKQKLINNDF